MKPMKREYGFTLIEMMIALFMTMIVMAAVVQVYRSSADSNRRLQGLAAIQDNARFAISTLQRTIQEAGYTGCMSTNMTVSNQLANPTSYPNDFAVPMVGYESTGAGVWSQPLDASITLPLAGSDILTVRGAVGAPVNVLSGMTGLNGAVPISTNNSFAATNPKLLVSDCNGFGDIFQKTNTAAGSAAHVSGAMNASANLSRVYGPSDFAVPVETTTFYLRSPAGAGGVNSLYMIQGGGPMEMVRGVDGMQILYGEATGAVTGTASDTSANRYLTADQVTDWSKVVSVRIGLLLSTPDPSVRQPDNNIYTVLGAKYGPYGDTRLRRIYETTISLRNRSLK